MCSSGFRSGCGCPWPGCTLSSCQHQEELRVAWGNRDAHSVSHDSKSRAHTPDYLSLTESTQGGVCVCDCNTPFRIPDPGERARAQNPEIPLDADPIPTKLFSVRMHANPVCAHARATCVHGCVKAKDKIPAQPGTFSGSLKPVMH